MFLKFGCKTPLATLALVTELSVIDADTTLSIATIFSPYYYGVVIAEGKLV
jgi:hypothetical protein